MSASAVGVDIIEIERVEAALERFGERFLGRVYTAVEVAFCRGRAQELAARFAAKEAVMKALVLGDDVGLDEVGHRFVDVALGELGVAPAGAVADELVGE